MGTLGVEVFLFAMHNLEHAATQLGLWSAILLAIGVLWTRGVRPVLKVLKTLVHVSDRLEVAVPVLEEISKEFKPNHGRSLADVVGRMDRNIRANADNNRTLYQLLSSLPDANAGLFPEMKALEEAPSDEEYEDRENQAS